MVEELPEERKNSIVVPIYKKGDKQKVENHREINLLNACYKFYSKVLNVKLQAQAEQFLLEYHNGFQKGRSCIEPLCSMKLLIEKRREFNLEIHLAFLDFVKAFDRVKREKFVEMLQSKNIPTLLLRSVRAVYSGNKIKAKINDQVSEEHSITHGVRQGCPVSPTLLNIYMHEFN